jgi:DNA-directed RNA polymerase specialized sigma24 family protein
MHQQPRRAPAAAHGGGLPRVEPSNVRAERPVPREWLAAHEADAERLDRLLGDVELVSRLQWAGFEGAEYARFAEELARYGLAVLTSWMFHRTIFEKVKQRGFGGLPALPDWEWDRDDRDQLATDTVVDALIRFRNRVLIPNKWDHNRGATLKTYFIGQCLMCFANVYRAWHQRQLSWDEHHRPLPEHADQWIARDRQVEHDAVVSDELRRALDGLDERTRTVLIMKTWGFQQSEIAMKLSCTEKAVEMIVRRHSHRLVKQGESRNEVS